MGIRGFVGKDQYACDIEKVVIILSTLTKNTTSTIDNEKRINHACLSLFEFNFDHDLEVEHCSGTIINLKTCKT